MPAGGKHLKPNRLWLARKRRRLRQKQVAYVLSHHTADQVSRYEKGTRMPTLETALMLEIIYRVPLRLLYSEMYVELQNEVRRKAESSRGLRHIADDTGEAQPGNPQEFCTHADALNAPSISEAEKARVYRHVRELAKKLAYL